MPYRPCYQRAEAYADEQTSHCGANGIMLDTIPGSAGEIFRRMQPLAAPALRSGLAVLNHASRAVLESRSLAVRLTPRPFGRAGTFRLSYFLQLWHDITSSVYD
jgi:hypothetical protein